ncbi:sulfide/dihydroorotate dehydrogenase-like FAD/NAD-binding protein [candidate division WOR-3 bacterium]|nr:sulfide/dihydroorotate dehydrogenase-like FAD/NAD-binding protein [candidate division WOR-3 bacterium]
MYPVIEKTLIAENTICQFTVKAPEIARKVLPGQFVIVKATNEGERIPLTVADKNTEEGTITLIFQVIGKTTAILRNLGIGENIKDVVGPLGKPTHLENFGTVVCVGGGTGIAILHHLTKALYEMGNEIISIIGARTKSLIIMEKEMGLISHQLLVCTDDGSYGTRGFVTDLLKDVISKRQDVKQIVAIGPTPMMRACVETAKNPYIPILVSLNPIMLDGTGMCGVCRCTVGGKTKFACVDGPDFDGHEVDFDELDKRLRMYLIQERESLLSSIK